MSQLFETEHLKSFVAIVDSGSFTRAAESVNKTQSAISMQMRKLEECVGKPIFERDGRASKLTDDGERLLNYARRIIRLNMEAAASFSTQGLSGRVRLGVPDEYAERYLLEILGIFSKSNPQVEVTVVCEPTLNLIPLLRTGELDLAIVFRCDEAGSAQIMRREKLLWVTSARHSTHEKQVLPLALGQPSCPWRQLAITKLESQAREFRILFASWSSKVISAAVMAGLAVSVLPESAVQSGMRILGSADGFAELGHWEIGLLTNRLHPSSLADALAAQIIASLDNLSNMG